VGDSRLRPLRQKYSHALPTPQAGSYQDVGKTVREPAKIVKRVLAASLILIDEQQRGASGAIRVPVADIDAYVVGAGNAPGEVVDERSIVVGWRQLLFQRGWSGSAVCWRDTFCWNSWSSA
jgi:hypothetical protein